MIQKIFFFSRDVTRSFEAQKVIYQLFAETWRNFWQNCFFYFLRSKRVMKRFLSKKKWQKVLFLFNSWLNFSQQNFGQKPAQLCIYPRKRKLTWFSFTKLNQHSKSPFHSFLLDFVTFCLKKFSNICLLDKLKSGQKHLRVVLSCKACRHSNILKFGVVG